MFFHHLGEYIILVASAFRKPEKASIYTRMTFAEMNKIGVESIPIVIIVSVFMGAVTTIQTGYQLVAAWIPPSIIGGVVSESTILELSPTVTSLVLAGKIGSSISTELGTMRVSEQIDALEVMGIHSPTYLILPKIIAAVIMFPILVTFSIALSIGGGMLAGHYTGIVDQSQFLVGAREVFKTYSLIFSLTKACTFAFLIATVSSYHGYYTSGGALGVGKSSTKAVVYSSIAILFFDYILAQLFL